ncbi:hypothetical protein [Leucobacter triazinivorans]|uniref:hypothetical protein n=1 Tax=Leucobacter triazinivorans TaxID=1784719 RepID=UPI0013EE8E49|nr:hypothetical protein [Leucobacter triazinivorans]
MAHVAIAARLDSLAAKDRRTADALEALARSTGSCDLGIEVLIERHRRLAADLEDVAEATREGGRWEMPGSAFRTSVRVREELICPERTVAKKLRRSPLRRR